MKRYHIVYGKNGIPMSAWRETIEEAHAIVKQLRRAGYLVDVWERTKDGSRQISL